MNKKADNREWEKEAPVLAGLPKSMPFRVPDNYFNQLTAQIENAVFLTGLTIKEKQGFKVPVNYFEELKQQIESKVATDQINVLVKGDGFTTPANYFEQLKTDILNKTITKTPETKIVRLWHTDLIKYVSAACFIIMAASALYLNQQQVIKQKANTDLAAEQLLLDIDENVIINYLDAANTHESKKLTQAETELYILNNFSTNDLTTSL
ncbi:MAG: hypothetical protein V4541_14980 [Bacteroidota bacterium]